MTDEPTWAQNDYYTILTFFETNLAGIEIFLLETETRGRLNSSGFFTLRMKNSNIVIIKQSSNVWLLEYDNYL